MWILLNALNFINVQLKFLCRPNIAERALGVLLKELHNLKLAENKVIFTIFIQFGNWLVINAGISHN